MNIVTTEAGAIDCFRPVGGLMDLKNAGFNSMLLNYGLFCHLDVLWPYKRKATGDDFSNPDVIKRSYDTFIDTCKKENISLNIARLPAMGLTYDRTDMEDFLKKVIDLRITCIKDAKRLGIKYVIADPLCAGIDRELLWEANKKHYLELSKACEDSDIQILLVNQCRDVNGHLVRGNCAEAEQAIQWMDALNDEVGSERFAFCLDVGNCYVCGQDVREVITTLGNRIKAVILNDNDGQYGAGLPFVYNPGGPDGYWLGVIRGLRDQQFDGELIVDFGRTVGGFSPMLKPAALTLAKEVAEHFKWQIGLENLMKKYDHIALFGAGNMCRNYLINYGDKYPALFTCDNNSARWGEDFFGLEIKSPEALKDVPPNTGIFICNMYYREIEAQLRDMGITNIEYFNDEYMPTFKMDRLKRG